MSESGYIYVISNDLYASRHQYKVGKFKRDKAQLLSRYRTYFIQPRLHFFRQCGSYGEAEKEILERLDEYRLQNDRGRKSEFVQMPLEELLKVVQEVCDLYLVEEEGFVLLPCPVKCPPKRGFMRRCWDFFSRRHPD